MKKFIKSLVLTLIILPCIVFMSACGGNSPPEEPEYELTVQSIYELVQAKGYEGTFDEFLSAIKGDKGDAGAPGQNGTDGKDGRGITSIELTASIGGYDTYTITYSDNTTSTYTITNGKDGQDGTPGADGRGIVSITKLEYIIKGVTSLIPEYYTYRILYTDGTYFDYRVYNGLNGVDGKDGTSITSITQTNNDANNSSTITITDSNGDKKEFTLYNGADGKDGTGIDTITKTSTDGLVDTYTITFTNDKTPFTYTVTNGKDGTDGIGIEDLTINTDGELEITLTNSDTPINLGKVKGEDGKDGSIITEITKTNTSGLIDTYTISCSDGKEFTFTVTNGKDGEDGRGIKSIKQIETTEADGRTKTTIIFEYTDGTESDPIYLYSGKKGEKGEAGEDGLPGHGITGIEVNESKDGKSIDITMTYSWADEPVTFTIYNGKDGQNGTDGRGIISIAKTSTNELVDTYTITYTDNTTSTFNVTNGVGVTDAEINANNELVISLSDGKTINVGNVKGDTGNGIESIEKTKTEGLIDTYIITYTNNTTTSFTITNGKDGVDGEDGRGIKTIKQTETTEADGRIKTTIVFEYTDGTFSDPIYIFSGKDGANGNVGKDGVGITNITTTESQDGLGTTITITYGDNNLTETFTIYNGKDGADGDAGRGITSIAYTSSNGLIDTYTITYSDNTTSTFTVTNGKDGVSVVGASINSDGELIINLSDEQQINVGNIKGANGTDGRGITSITKSSSEDLVDTYTITYSDNTTSTFTITNGKDGADGRGIQSIKQTEISEADGRIKTEIIVYYTDGTSSSPFYIYSGKDGSNGSDGRGIISISQSTNNDNNSTLITITYSDNTSDEFTIYNGTDGRGITSIAKSLSNGLIDTYTITYTDNTTSTFTITNGKDGTDGKDGVSVVNASINADGELIITLSDEKTINVGNVKGETGNGIESIEKTKTDGLKDTYTITYTNGDTTTFTVVNGRGIKEIKKESNGLVDTYTITYTDNSEPYTFTVTNGQNGLSAYEIYKIHNPAYTKSEAEWIIDLTNGDLSTNRLTVTFDSNGGTEVESQTNIKFGGKATKPTDPTKDGYLFDGWYYQGEKWSFVGYSVTEDMTLTANWTPISYTISFNTNGYGEYDSIELTFEDDLVFPTPVITGYTYDWKVNGEIITNGKWNIASDTTIELVLTAIEYTITYVLDDGINNPLNPEIYTIESNTITLSDASKDNYYFVGWYETSDFTGNKITTIESGSTGNITLYACFKDSVVVSINANGGVSEVDTIEIIYGEEFSLPIPEAPEGYGFVEWIYDVEYKNGSIYSYKILSGDKWIWSDITEVVAKWAKIFENDGEKITGLTTFGQNQQILYIPSQINGVTITTLGEYSLYYSKNLQELYIPTTITTLEYRAIYGLKYLTKVYFNATKLNNLTNLDNANFVDCGISSDGYDLVIGKDVERIPDYFMFNNEVYYAGINTPGTKNKVKSITFEQNSICFSIGAYAFRRTDINQILLPNTITNIGSYAFAEMPIKEITLPDTLNSYGNGLFYSCKSLEVVNNFPKNSTKINDNTFYNCSSLKDFIIPNQILEIGESAFYNCSTITSIDIPNNVTTIGKEAFYNCTSLTTISILNKVSAIGEKAFNGLVNVNTLNFNSTNLSDFSESHYVFENLGANTNGVILNVGKEVSRIPAKMFDYTSQAPKITEIIYDSECKLEEIGSCAFSGLKVTHLTIPSTVKYIGYRAFCDMLYLEEVIFNAKELTYKSGTTNGNGNLNQLFVGCGRNAGGTKIIIGKDVENLNYKIFDCSGYAYANKITTIDFSNNSKINTIPDNFFEGTYWITTLILPKTITQIGASAFYSESETTHINTIFYIGNQSEFANIMVDNTDDGNKYFNNAEVYYYAEPSGFESENNGLYWYFEDGEIKTWEYKKNLITYHLDGGVNNDENPEHITSLDDDCILKNPTKNGFTFGGWYTDSEFTNQITKIESDISEDLEFWAKFTIINYSITYNLDYGTNNQQNPSTYNINEEVIFLIPTKADFKFLGWFADSEFETQVAKIEIGTTGNIELWAKWYYTKCVVSLNADGGELETNQVLVDKNKFCSLPVPTKEGYLFAGWYNGEVAFTDSEGYSIANIGETESLNLTAHWGNSATITFKSNGGSTVETLTAITGSSLAMPTNPTRYNYAFDGWYYDNTTFANKFETSVMPNENITLYAKWIEYIVTITHTNNQAISINDVIIPTLLGAVATDNCGNTFDITITNITGTQNAGDIIDIRLSATGLYNKSATAYVNDVKVYGAPTISYDTSKDYINLSDEINAELFNVSVIDTFGNQLDSNIFVIEESYVDGDIVNIKITSTDSANNTSEVILENIKVYGNPTISHSNIEMIKVSDTINADLFNATAVDDFNNTLTVSATIESGTKSAGNTITIKLYAIDSKGNEQVETFDVKVYGTPSISSASKTDFKVEDEITLESLGITATDSFGHSVNIINLSIKTGTQTAGSTMTYLVTATDIAGNVATKTITVNIYGIPTITYNNNKLHINVSDTINAELFNATAKDSFNNFLTVSTAIISGEQIGGTYIKVRFSATDKVGNYYEIESGDIAVYDVADLTVSYNANASDYININSNGEEFSPITSDSFGNETPVEMVIVSGTKKGGNLVSIKIKTIDNAGNEVYGDLIKNIKVYENINISYNREALFIYENELFEYFVVAIDDFDDTLETTIEIIDGEFVAGSVVSIKVSATDISGNYAEQTFTLDVLSLSQVYVKISETNEQYFSSYQVININEDYCLNYKMEFFDKDGIRYTDKEGRSLIQFSSIGYFELITNDITNFVEQVSTSSYINLDRNIDLGGIVWTPLNLTNATFNGNGYTISNFKITTGRTVNGFFGTVTNSTIKNLGLENFTIDYTHNRNVYVGGLVGDYVGGTITNCYATGNINIIASGINAGGLVGRTDSSTTITNCYATGDVNAPSSAGVNPYAGGLVGLNNGTISNSYATGNVSVSSRADIFAGGLVGRNFGTISNSYATGNINTIMSARYDIFAGGLVGAVDYATITNCYATGDVNATSSAYVNLYVGGLVGFVNDSTITNSYRYEGQTITAINVEENGTISEVGTSASMEEIWAFVKENWDDNIWNLYNDKNPVLNTPIQIFSANDLINLQGDNLSASYILTSDIDLGGIEWEPIDLVGGIFDGNDHIISNFKITTGRQYNGFFGIVENSTIENLGLENFTIKYTYSNTTYAGGLVGYADDSTITNCYATGDVSVTSSSYAGGLVGSVSSTTITNCYATGDVIATSYNYDAYAGGLIGYADDTTITNCHATGNVSTYFYAYVGGLVGYAYSSTTITNCYATGNVSTYYAYVGGLVGYAYSSTTITNCYATGDVSATCRVKYVYAGGLVGYADDTTITNCYTTGDVSVTSSDYNAYAGGLVGYADDTIITNCYATGDVSATVTLTSSAIVNVTASVGGLVGYVSSTTITNCYRYEGQAITAKGGDRIRTSTEGTSASMEEIWAIVKENWDAEIWNLSKTENPTLKQVQS